MFFGNVGTWNERIKSQINFLDISSVNQIEIPSIFFLIKNTFDHNSDSCTNNIQTTMYK